VAFGIRGCADIIILLVLSRLRGGAYGRRK
jgi:hypothetical protein